jgi:hypothetical protein
MLYNLGSVCWLQRVSKTLKIYNININVDNIGDLRYSTNTIYEVTQHKLLSDLSDTDKYPKLRTYKEFKTEMRIEPYLNLNLPKKLYCSIARFRLSSHNLNIELGRHKRPYVEPENRLCEKCNLNLVEDEKHFLMVCPKWNNLRLNLMQVAADDISEFKDLSLQNQFLKIMSSKELKVNLALGQFLSVALNT